MYSNKYGSESRLIPLILSEKLQRYKNEILVFLMIFILVLFSKKLLPLGSSGNVEQWVNITNQMFYGHQDFLFSYGPLYWLVGGTTLQYNEISYWLAVVFISLSNAFFWMLVLNLIHRSKSYLLFTVAFVILLKSVILSVAFFMWPFVMVSYFEFSKNETLKSNKYIVIILGAFVAFAMYIRFFYGLFGFLTIGAYLFSRFFVDKKILLPIYFFLSVIVVYCILGSIVFHDYSSVISYIKINSQLSLGNSVDMTLEVNNSARSFIYAFLTLLFMNVYLLIRRHWVLLLSVNGLWLLLFKLGFSRTDHYLNYFVLPVTVLTFIMLFDKSRIGKVLFILSIASLYLLASIETYPGATTINFFDKPVTFDSDYVNRIEKNHTEEDIKVVFDSDYATRMKHKYPEFILKDDVQKAIAASKIDFYPYNNEYAFANKLNYWHRPLFQNYMTLTPELDQMNSVFYNSSDKPKFVLWTSGISCWEGECNPFDGFDMKYSLNEDPLTSEAILYNYHPVLLSSGKNNTPILLLEKNEVAVTRKKNILLNHDMVFGQWYEVPNSSEVIKIMPEINLTLLGRLKNMLFRGSVIKIKYKLDTGEIKTYRLNILNAASGVWVSPLPYMFNEKGIIGSDVKYIMFETDAKYYFSDRFAAKFVSLNLPGIQKGKGDLVDELSPSPTVSTNTECSASIDRVDGSLLEGKSGIEVSRVMNVEGWMAFSTDAGTLFNEALITLTSPNGHKYFFTTKIQQRGDVANFFKHASLSLSGFKSIINLSKLRGNYTLGLAGVYDDKVYNCSNFNFPIIIK